MDLDAAAGSILALLGENGAGKSTLVQILAGDYTPDAGEIEIGDADVHAPDPVSARAAGVRMIYQEFQDAPTLTRRREHLARPAAARAAASSAGATVRERAPDGARRRWASSSIPTRRSASLRHRRAAGRRDRARALGRGARADPRRADRRALAAGGRPALRLPAAPARAGASRSSTSPTGSTRCTRSSDRVAGAARRLRRGRRARRKDFDRRALVEAMIGRSAVDVGRPPPRDLGARRQAGARVRARDARSARSTTSTLERLPGRDRRALRQARLGVVRGRRGASSACASSTTASCGSAGERAPRRARRRRSRTASASCRPTASARRSSPCGRSPRTSRPRPGAGSRTSRFLIRRSAEAEAYRRWHEELLDPLAQRPDAADRHALGRQPAEGRARPLARARHAAARA